MLPFLFTVSLQSVVINCNSILLFAGSSKMDSPMLSHDSRHKPGESRTSSRPGRPAVSGYFKRTMYRLPLWYPLIKPGLKSAQMCLQHIIWFDDTKHSFTWHILPPIRSTFMFLYASQYFGFPSCFSSSQIPVFLLYLNCAELQESYRRG